MTRKTEGPSAHLVVIGASAGGISALATLVAALPRDFPAPLVLAQHLSPEHPSHLDAILAQHSALPVRTVTDSETLADGVVFVVPSNQHVEIVDGTVHLSTERRGRPKPSIDLLFRSAAQAYGDRLIAVILMGSGSDGVAGAREVKKAGGTVVIQNPETAAFPALPRALAPTTVDIVADLERIGPLLRDLLSRTGAPASPDHEAALRALLDDVHLYSGIDFSRYKTSTIMRRVQRRLVATGMQTLEDYHAYVRSHPDEYQRLVGSFLIKVTEFFRDRELFAYLREQVLPEIIARARTRDNELRLWSAGCATGEEAYSLAILIAEALGDELERFSVRIFATDLDANAIAFARRGIYPATARGALPAWPWRRRVGWRCW